MDSEKLTPEELTEEELTYHRINQEVSRIWIRKS